MFLLIAVLLALGACPGLAQTCTGNGFVGKCADIFTQTGKAVNYAELVGSGSVTEICEGDRLAVTHDCGNRIPLYVTYSMDRTQIDAPNPDRYSGDFRPSTHIDNSFQAVDSDYTTANDRTPCYEREEDGKLYEDMFWVEGSNPDLTCSSGHAHEGTSRGHMIADSYIRSPESDKAATYHFTNCIPQYQDFNSGAWNVAEQAFTTWVKQYCGSDISDPTVRNNAMMYTIVGVLPSTAVTSTFDKDQVSPRWFGEWGFGDGEFTATTTYSAGTPSWSADYRVNMPAAMWTAGCCVATDADDAVTYVAHTAFGRHAKPNNDVTVRVNATLLMAQMMPDLDTSGINLFPNEAGCNNLDNYYVLQ